jgi:phenylacetate-CoA ligase
MNSSMSRVALRLHEKLTGRRILARLEELNRTQWLNRDKLMTLQRTKLQHLLDYAYQYVPYYQRTFDDAGFKPGDFQQDLSSLYKIPILTKEIIRKNWDQLVTTEPERRRHISKRSTSGSTGKPLIFMQDNDFRDYVTADLQRHMSWGGWKLGDLHAFFWGKPKKQTMQKKLRSHLTDWVWNRFIINAFSVNDEVMIAFAKRLHRQKVKIIFGYPSCLYHFARFLQSSPFQGITFESIFSSAEVLIPSERKFIEDTFQCRIFDRYGTTELGALACECQEHTGYHISSENSYIEILKNLQPAEPDEVGDIVVTNLNNLGMPFIRYNSGDAGAWSSDNDCPCGRAFPMLKTIEGRISDSFKTQDGRTIFTHFSSGFQCLTDPTIKQFQVVQKSLDKMIVRLILYGEIPQSALDVISKDFRDVFGENVKVEFEFPNEIPLLPSGKHQYAISELSKS